MSENNPIPTPEKADIAQDADREILRALARASVHHSEIQKAELGRVRAEERWHRFKTFSLLALIGLMALVYTTSISSVVWNKTESHVALVEMDGVISADQMASADHVVPSLRSAFEAQYSKGVIFKVNSPGGSPAQSEIILKEIQLLRAKFPDKPFIVVAEDLLASGGYLIAMGADEIYAQPMSIVGSIGVVSESFGFQRLMSTIGVEHRVFTAGDNKRRMTPFREVTDEDRAFVHDLLERSHAEFKNYVRVGRQGKLKADESVLFSGSYWLGVEALELGLIDGLKTVSEIRSERFAGLSVRKYQRRDFDALLAQFSQGAWSAVKTSAMSAYQHLRLLTVF